jgi:hypothetical protein
LTGENGLTSAKAGASLNPWCRKLKLEDGSVLDESQRDTGLYGMQAPELHYEEEQAERSGPHRDKEILRLVPHSHFAP